MDTINAIGRRKSAVARVYLGKGKGEIVINGKPLAEYFPVSFLQDQVKMPMAILEVSGDFNVTVNVAGGGIKGQAEAIRLGIARALVEVNEEWKPALKEKGIMTRDSRKVERKKYGLRKARRATQFSKR
jgi:small subunit ribosomal protein S9